MEQRNRQGMNLAWNDASLLLFPEPDDRGGRFSSQSNRREGYNDRGQYSNRGNSWGLSNRGSSYRDGQGLGGRDRYSSRNAYGGRHGGQYGHWDSERYGGPQDRNHGNYTGRYGNHYHDMREGGRYDDGRYGNWRSGGVSGDRRANRYDNRQAGGSSHDGRSYDDRGFGGQRNVYPRDEHGGQYGGCRGNTGGGRDGSQAQDGLLTAGRMASGDAPSCPDVLGRVTPSAEVSNFLDSSPDVSSRLMPPCSSTTSTAADDSKAAASTAGDSPILHSMESQTDGQEEELEMAKTSATASQESGQQEEASVEGVLEGVDSQPTQPEGLLDSGGTLTEETPECGSGKDSGQVHGSAGEESLPACPEKPLSLPILDTDLATLFSSPLFEMDKAEAKSSQPPAEGEGEDQAKTSPPCSDKDTSNGPGVEAACSSSAYATDSSQAENESVTEEAADKGTEQSSEDCAMDQTTSQDIDADLTPAQGEEPATDEADACAVSTATEPGLDHNTESEETEPSVYSEEMDVETDTDTIEESQVSFEEKLLNDESRSCHNKDSTATEPGLDQNAESDETEPSVFCEETDVETDTDTIKESQVSFEDKLLNDESRSCHNKDSTATEPGLDQNAESEETEPSVYTEETDVETDTDIMVESQVSLEDKLLNDESRSCHNKENVLRKCSVVLVRQQNVLKESSNKSLKTKPTKRTTAKPPFSRMPKRSRPVKNKQTKKGPVASHPIRDCFVLLTSEKPSVKLKSTEGITRKFPKPKPSTRMVSSYAKKRIHKGSASFKSLPNGMPLRDCFVILNQNEPSVSREDQASFKSKQNSGCQAQHQVSSHRSRSSQERSAALKATHPAPDVKSAGKWPLMDCVVVLNQDLSDVPRKSRHLLKSMPVDLKQPVCVSSQRNSRKGQTNTQLTVPQALTECYVVLEREELGGVKKRVVSSRIRNSSETFSLSQSHCTPNGNRSLRGKPSGKASMDSKATRSCFVLLTGVESEMKGSSRRQTETRVNAPSGAERTGGAAAAQPVKPCSRLPRHREGKSVLHNTHPSSGSQTTGLPPCVVVLSHLPGSVSGQNGRQQKKQLSRIQTNRNLSSDRSLGNCSVDLRSMEQRETRRSKHPVDSKLLSASESRDSRRSQRYHRPTDYVEMDFPDLDSSKPAQNKRVTAPQIKDLNLHIKHSVTLKDCCISLMRLLDTGVGKEQLTKKRRHDHSPSDSPYLLDRAASAGRSSSDYLETKPQKQPRKEKETASFNGNVDTSTASSLKECSIVLSRLQEPVHGRTCPFVDIPMLQGAVSRKRGRSPETSADERYGNFSKDSSPKPSVSSRRETPFKSYTSPESNKVKKSAENACEELSRPGKRGWRNKKGAVKPATGPGRDISPSKKVRRTGNEDESVGNVQDLNTMMFAAGIWVKPFSENSDEGSGAVSPERVTNLPDLSPPLTTSVDSDRSNKRGGSSQATQSESASKSGTNNRKRNRPPKSKKETKQKRSSKRGGKNQTEPSVDAESGILFIGDDFFVIEEQSDFEDDEDNIDKTSGQDESGKKFLGLEADNKTPQEEESAEKMSTEKERKRKRSRGGASSDSSVTIGLDETDGHMYMQMLPV